MTDGHDTDFALGNSRTFIPYTRWHLACQIALLAITPSRPLRVLFVRFRLSWSREVGSLDC